MTERSAFDILLDYPKSKGLDYDSSNRSKRAYLIQSDSVSKTKYVIFKSGELFFVAFDDYGSKLSRSQTFSGLYGVYPDSGKLDISILKRFALDSIFNRKRKVTGDPIIDKRFTIKSEIPISLERFFGREDATKFEELSEKVSPIELLIKSQYLDLVAELKGNNVIGIETNEWLYDHEKIDYLLQHGGKLITDMINSAKTWH